VLLVAITRSAVPARGAVRTLEFSGRSEYASLPDVGVSKHRPSDRQGSPRLRRLISSCRGTPHSPLAGLSEAIPRATASDRRHIICSNSHCSALITHAASRACPLRPSRRRALRPVDLAGLLCTASRWQHCCAAASSTSLNLRRRYSLTATIENDDARADEFCSVTENQAGLNGFNDGEEAKPVIDRFGNPTVSPRNVA
jgi:hypothetical protein